MIKQKGFTLIELLVVVAIIGILAAVLVQKIMVAYKYTASAKINAVKNNFKIAEKKLIAITMCKSAIFLG